MKRNDFAWRAMVFVFACLVGFSFAGAAQVQRQPGAAPAAGQATEESPNDLFVNVGKSVIIDSSLPIQRVSVGFGDVAEATAVGPQEVLVNGKAAGQTSLIIWQQGGSKLFFDITVQPSRFAADVRLETLRRQFSKELPGQKIEPTVENDLVFVRGSVKDLTSADRAMAIASSLGKAVNLLYVDVPKPEAQILLKVKFASVDRNLSTQLGVNLFSLGATNTIGATTTQQFPSLPGATLQGFSTKGNLNTPATIQNYTLSNALNVFFFRPDLDLGATIQALQTRGLLEVLAEPNVLTENGKQASFLAGGEFPYPVVQGGTTGGTTAITVQFRQFGVRLNFIPTITPRGTIQLQVAPEVSSLDYTNGVSVQGFTVPGVSVRNVNTEVELAEGQSFAIGGLLDNRETESFQKIPFIGDLPILGHLFKSKSQNRQNTELLVIVTPELVRPIPAGHPLPSLNYPVPFLPPNTNMPMMTPGQNVTGPVPVTPPTQNVPVETLVKSLQQKPLEVNPTTGRFGGASSLPGSSGGAPPVPSPIPNQ
ncbi:MAG TPA: pilus assembly protein N-terminal domain-containing protein [Bryobacteraceae bacterium]